MRFGLLLDLASGRGTADRRAACDRHPRVVTASRSIFWMIIPGKARFLKEFFDVGHGGDEPRRRRSLHFQNGNATLQLPDGLSLAPTANAQSLSVAMPDIPGQTSKAHPLDHPRRQAPAVYTIQTVYTGHARAVRRACHVHAPRTRTRSRSGARTRFRSSPTPTTRRSATYPYRVRIGLKNVTDSDPANATDVYNPSVELLTEGTLNYIYSPTQQLEFGTDVIQPGETWFTPVLRAVSRRHRHPRPERFLHRADRRRGRKPAR